MRYQSSNFRRHLPSLDSTLTLIICCSAILFLLWHATANAQMLTQTNRDIGKGYFLQESQQVNVPGRWHSDRRNHFLYYGKRYVCQCTFYSISEQGRFVIFQTVGNKDVMLFDAKLNQVETIRKLAPEKLSEMKWDDKTEWKVTVTQIFAEDKTKTTKLSLPHKSK